VENINGVNHYILMADSREIAFDLLSRLLAGERDDVPWHLALLLEKASRLDRGDDLDAVEGDYRRILPAELASVRLSPETSKEIIAILCREISRNPDHFLISTSLSTGAALAIKTVSGILTNPPRPLTLSEYAIALSYLAKFLPSRLSKDSEFLLKSDLEQLALVVNDLQSFESGETDQDKSARATIRQFGPALLKSLTRSGK
jgi:hypothetical protein